MKRPDRLRFRRSTALLIAALGLTAWAAAVKAPEGPPPDAVQLKARALATVSELVAAYNSKQRRAVTKLVADDFVGDSSKLDDDLRQDFKLYPSVELSLRQQAAVVSTTTLTVLVPFHYELTVSAPFGGTHEFSGDSSFELAWRDGRMLLRRIGAPIFGQTSTEDLEAGARDSIAKLAAAYTNKRRSAFMRLVSDDFLGNTSTFEDALLSDFRAYRIVNLQIFVDQVVIARKKADVVFHYNLSTVDSSGDENAFSGSSDFTFIWEDGQAKLYKMSLPLIFGNSLPLSQNPISTPGPQPNNTGTAPGPANPPAPTPRPTPAPAPAPAPAPVPAPPEMPPFRPHG
jgi:hypothetical protein